MREGWKWRGLRAARGVRCSGSGGAQLRLMGELLPLLPLTAPLLSYISHLSTPFARPGALSLLAPSSTVLRSCNSFSLHCQHYPLTLKPHLA